MNEDPTQGESRPPADPAAGLPSPYVPQPYPAYPPYPGYPPPPPRPSFPHDRPRPYHEMLRTWTYRWWRSAVGIVIVLVGFVIVAPVVALPILVVGAALESGDFADNFSRAANLEEITPALMLYLNVSLGGAILVTWFTIRVMHGMRPRWLASVLPRLRWNFLFICLGLAVVALVAGVVVGAFLPSTGTDADLGGELNDFTSTTAWLVLIVLLTTPFQAAGEEYVFRGYLLQATGSFVEKPWWKWFTILLTALLFAVAHLQFSPPIFFDRFAFGVVAAWVAIRTGGLEAGIALHVLNNYVAFGFALAFGDISGSLNDPQASWWNIFVTLAQSVVFAALVWFVARRMNLVNVTRPPLAAPSAGATQTQSV